MSALHSLLTQARAAERAGRFALACDLLTSHALTLRSWRRRHQTRAAQLLDRAISTWNANHPPGTLVQYWSWTRDEAARIGRTDSRAWAVCGSACVKVEGHPGGISLTHVEAIAVTLAPDQVRSLVWAFCGLGRGTERLEPLRAGGAA